MTIGTVSAMTKSRAWLTRMMVRPAVLACVPAVCLAVFWAAGQTGLIGLAIVFPLIYLLLGSSATQPGELVQQRDPITGLFHRSAFDRFVTDAFERASLQVMHSATIAVEVDDASGLASRYGRAAADLIAIRLAERIVSTLRDSDAVARVGDFRFSACLAPVRQFDLELGIQLAGRLQNALEEPISVDGLTVYVTASVGFCLNHRAPDRQASAWMEAANIALGEAQHRGHAAIRAYSAEMGKRTRSQAELRENVAKALDAGEITPWFQPQISTDTGRITGFEALARWQHPQRGMVSPAEFLPALEQAGLLERLADVMMFHSFTALKAWDLAGVDVPQVGINFAGPELNNPKLVEKVQWELDRFDLSPGRLAVEVLETVVTGDADDTTTRNINGLSDLGCRIDLDDFGTGHASIASIRRFSVSRIKIDRSFVMKADRDPEQQRMISAILTMAERLNVETLAEGVETVGEHALLAQLGCNHVQGFGIAKPMPFDDTIAWVQSHNAKLADTPRILGNKTK
jgi:diguanylate cyclase (GGDEF)-like protein